MLAVAVLVALTVQVVHDTGIVTLDEHLRSWIAHHQRGFLHHVASGTTRVLSPEVDIVVFLLYARLSPRVRFLAAAATVVAATAAVIVLKATVGRPLPTRPSHFYGGYPSGHTAAILVCAGAAIILSDLDERRRRQCWVATAAATTLVAVSLLYIEVHWLSDILASIALAAAVLWVVAVTHSPHVMSRSPDPAPPPDHS